MNDTILTPRQAKFRYFFKPLLGIEMQKRLRTFPISKATLMRAAFLKKRKFINTQGNGKYCLYLLQEPLKYIDIKEYFKDNSQIRIKDRRVLI